MGKRITSAKALENVKEPGTYRADDGLYLKVSTTGAKKWVFRYSFAGKRRDMGIKADGLADARRKALEAKRQIMDGIDPINEKERQQRARVTIPTFGDFADDYVSTHESKFKNAKHKAQWRSTLSDRYCKAIRSLPINVIDTELVLKVLQPIWSKTPETASRIRGRIENVIDAARARNFFRGENPCRWKGHLKTLLPARKKLARGHHAALPYKDLPEFMTHLRAREALAALALEFTILTAVRTSETLFAVWDEIDLEMAIWVIPPQRMKAQVEHRIPLSKPTILLLEKLLLIKRPYNDFVFPGQKRNRPLSNMSMLKVLYRMGMSHITVHGFRSTFSDWVSEQTSFSHEAREHALAHQIANKAEAAYRRGDQLEKRIPMMQAWANYCGSAKSEGNVVQLKGLV